MSLCEGGESVGDSEAVRVLVLTVGSSDQPLRSVLRETRPHRVVFVCTAAGADGTAGSEAKVPKIAAAAGLEPGAFEIEIVPHDDPDAAFARLRETFAALRRRFPSARIVADYTGGTKSMSVALVLAALANPGIDLQLMTGSRNTLVKVADGTERPSRIVPEAILVERRVAALVAMWRTFGYPEAADGLAAVHRDLARGGGAPSAVLARVADLRDLSAGFAAWDRFDHAGARDVLKGLADRHGDFLAPYLAALDTLCDPERQEPLLLVDLWRNAQRRAARGQYDDAVGRCYRLIEWTAQWLLRRHAGIDTGDVDLTKIPDNLRVKCKLQPDSDGRTKANLSQAWTLIEKLPLLRRRPAARFMREKNRSHPKRKTGGQERFEKTKRRNDSILAHGRSPIGKDGWNDISGWIESRFMPCAVEAEARESGVDLDLRQLPERPPETLA